MPTAPTRHYELSDWIDYVRGTGSSERLAELDAHLRVERCERCARLAEMLASAFGAARDLAAVEVPDVVVRRAEAIFTPAPTLAWWNLPARAAAWIAPPEGSLEWLPAGTRSAVARPARLYQHGSLQVRIHLENGADGSRVVVGTLSDSVDPGQFFPNCMILLVTGPQQVLAQTQSNEFGEFEMETAVHTKMRLVFPTPGSGERVEIEID